MWAVKFFAISGKRDEGMSRVGKKLIEIPDKTEVTWQDREFMVKGVKGRLSMIVHPAVDLVVENRQIRVAVANADKKTRALQGLTRSLVANLVTGVNQGFEKTLEINGIGYRVALEGQTLVISLGYSHPINFVLPEGIAARLEKNNVLILSGIDKELLGQVAANIRSLRPPDPYKGKGVKYSDEYIQRKAGKTGTK